MIAACTLAWGACGNEEGTIAEDLEEGMPPVPCTPESKTFAVGPAGIGVVAVGEKRLIQARVIDASPLRPKRFENDWTLAFMDSDGQPLDDIEVTGVCAYMTGHPHRRLPRDITRLDDPATVELSALNLFMRGNWRVQVAVRSESLGGAPSLSTLCDEQRPDTLGTDMLVVQACIEEQ
jgi:hypothetical protein